MQEHGPHSACDGLREVAMQRHDLLNASIRSTCLFCIAALTLFSAAGQAQEANQSLPTELTVAQIVDRMQQHNQNQAEALKHYEATRHYRVEYRGFAQDITATMDVAVSFDASSGKSFRILSMSGSKLLGEKVLKRAVESEKEASQNPEATALTPANYKFQLEKCEDLDQHPAYVLLVDPLTANKFLYRGRVWVDATDFAVMKVDALPAKNPSFWISRTETRYTNAKVHGFWLPQHNRSETRVKIGGSAVLTIDYGTYQVVPDTFASTQAP